MNDTIKIINGEYRINGESVSVANAVFDKAGDFKYGKNGNGYITVDARSVRGEIDEWLRKQIVSKDRNIRIQLSDPNCYMHLAEEGSAAEPQVKETDEETVERLRQKFQMLEDMTKAVKAGDVRAMIVSGPPGVGKSHGVEYVLNRHELVAQLGDGTRKYEVIKGAMSPIGLYCKLYQHRHKDHVVVFDDCDSIFSDELALNILKAALDSKKVRTINWNTDSFKLRDSGVPDHFRFEGSAIFITNVKFENVRSKKLRDHLEALESRCHYIDLTIDTEREKMLRISQIVQDGMLEEYEFEQQVQDDIVEFVDDNKTRLRELSLRTVLKIADLAKAFPDRWDAMAENTVMRR